MGNIVIVNETIQGAPTPNRLQSRGAIISQGATNLAAGSFALLTQTADLTALLASPLSLSSLAWSAGTVTATAAAAIPGLVTGDTFITKIAGATPSGYNGTFLATVASSTTFTYALANNPGSESVPGTYTPPNQGELLAMAGSFYGQGASQAVYVLELGAVDETTGPPVLSTFIAANPSWFYIYLVPRDWDGSAAFLALQAQYQSPTAMTYFFTTTTISTYTAYAATMKCIAAAVEAPGIPLTEFSWATAFQRALSFNPSPTNRMLPLGNGYVYGVTPYPLKNNATLLAALDAANISYIKTGVEGGLNANNIIQNGETLDGNDFSWWYSADYININAHQATAAAVIEGANNPLAPLYYNQDGFDSLQDVVVGQINIAIASGLATGTVTVTTLDPTTFAQNLANGVYAGQNVVNAVPWGTYVSLNPSDYGAGKYAGISVVYIPQNSFKQIVFNVLVTQLVATQ